jgi:cellulose synthase/poly-beta-1,6-N-acetylglucosamine synthase-like glycosyltransferase
MATALHLVLLAAALALLVPAATLLAQVLAARRIHDGVRPPLDGDRRPSIAVLIPAHDEASGIGPTLASVRAQTRPGDRVLVVADNCTDRTAEVARAGGADVVERFDAVRRGKGYALDAGVRAL